MRIKVMKFGGTSLNSPENRAQAASKVVQAKEMGYALVVVVSAIGRAGDPYATDTLIKTLMDVDPTIEPEARELDMMMACGEIISTVIFAHTLKSMGYSATALTGMQAGILTDTQHGKARILEIQPDAIHTYLDRGKIVVVCGFQGSAKSQAGTSEDSFTTLGRGGSDTTASALGAALKAESVEIYTDVDGVKTADPNSVESAITLDKVTYSEVAEIAHQGAKVLHPRAAEIAMKHNLSLWVRNTFSDLPGTEIVSDSEQPIRGITGVTHTGKINYLCFDLPKGGDKSKIELEIYRLIAQAESHLHLISVNPSYLGFAVPKERYKNIAQILEGLVIPFDDEEGKRSYVLQVSDPISHGTAAQMRLISSAGEQFGEMKPIRVKVIENCSMVSVIGQIFFNQPGYFYQMMETLHTGGIPVYQTADSEHSVSFLIPESDTDRAVRMLHERFQTTNVG